MSDPVHTLVLREALRELIARIGRNLDAKKFDDVVESFSTQGSYTVRAYSPEINKHMVWMSASREQLHRLLRDSVEHVHDLAERTHQINVDQISIEGDRAEANTTFSLFRTNLRGQSELFAVGHYRDQLLYSGNHWLICNRTVEVRTRMFTVPTPLPI